MKQIDVKDMSDKERRAADNEVAVLRALAVRVCCVAVLASVAWLLALFCPVQHPNIIYYRESFVHDGYLCIIMEYADGGERVKC